MVGLVNGDNITAMTAASPTSCTLWADYIYLDTDERRRFAQVSHEYLIEQLQFQENTLAASIKLNFNHPVKELIWINQHNTAKAENTTSPPAELVDATLNLQNAAATDGNDYFNYAGGAAAKTEIIHGQTVYEPFDTANLQLNGHDRFAKRNASYFRTCQPLQAGHRVPSHNIYVYSFALKPEEHQPSGTCNFSRIDNAQLQFNATATTTSNTTTVFAVNYNVLRIMSGMGGLAYSN